MQPKDKESAVAEQRYDYRLLNTPVTPTDHKAFDQRYGSNTKDRAWIPVVFFSIAFVVFSGIAVVAARTMEFGALATVLLFVIAIALAIGFAIKDARRRKAELVKLWRFAAANDMTFTCNQRDPDRTGMIFDEGRTRELTESLTLADGTELANYRYVTGSGKHQTTHQWGFIRIPLERSLPHMVLDAKQNNLFGKISNLSDTFDSNQTLSLEGDFDSYFTLYAPREYERDALYVFTPDVMAALIDSSQNYDMEVIGNELYLYRNESIDLNSEEELRNLLKIIGILNAELKTQSRRYADERVGDRAANIIAPQGARLKRGINWLVVGGIVLFLGYQFVPSLLTRDGVMLLPLVMPMLFGVLAVIIVMKKMKGGQ